MSRFFAIGMVCFALAIGGFLGCSTQTTEHKPVSQHLKKIGLAYIKATEKNNRAPANLKDLLPFLKDEGDPDELLKSPGDGEPFVIFWDVDHRAYAIEAKPLPVLVHEKTGSGGKRWVLRVNRSLHLTNEELQKEPFPPGQKAPS